MSSFLHFSICQNVLARFHFYSQTSSATISSTSILFAPNIVCVPCWVFLFWRKAKKISGNSGWHSLHLFAIEGIGTLCFLTLHDNSNHSRTMLKSWDTGCNTRFQLSISLAVAYSIVSCCLSTTIFTCNFFFSDKRRHFVNIYLTEWSAKEVKIEVTWLEQSKQNIGGNSVDYTLT